MELAEAISTFHNSETFSKLEDFDTGLYIESPADVYRYLASTRQEGKVMLSDSEQEEFERRMGLGNYR